MDQDATWHGVGLGPGHIVLHEDPTPLKMGTAAPKFSAHVYCGQTAARIKMPLEVDTEVGLGPGYIVLDGDPAPPKKGTAPPFRLMSIVATVAHLRYC